MPKSNICMAVQRLILHGDPTCPRIKLSDFPHGPSLQRAAPDPGADGAAILMSMGFDVDEIEVLRQSGVIT